MKQVRQGLLGGYVSWPGGFFILRLQHQSWFHLLFGKGKLTSSFATLSSMITFHKLKHISDVMMLGHLVDPLVFNVLWVEAYPYMVYVLYIYRQFKNSLFAMRIAIL